MTFKTKRLWALLMALAMLVGVMGTALAAEKYSAPVDLKGRLVRPQPTPGDTDEGQTPEQPGEPSTGPDTEEPGTEPGTDEPGTEPGTGEPGEPEQPEAPAEPEWEVVTEQEDGKVNLRRTPEIAEDNIITSIPRGARLTILEREGDWVKVVYNGQEGYVNARFVSEVSAEPEQPDEEEEPTEVPFESKYQRDEKGNLILDENGNPIPTDPETEAVEFERDEDGHLVLDENGEPVVVVEEKEEKPLPDDRSIRIEAKRDGEGDLVEGDTIVLTAILSGYEGLDYEIQWQVAQSSAGAWSDISGATGTSYALELNEDNYTCFYRATVTVSDEG